MLRFKVDVLVLLKKKGMSAHRMRVEKVFGGATLQKMRHRQIVSMNELDMVCNLLGAQPGELIEYVKEAPTEDN